MILEVSEVKIITYVCYTENKETQKDSTVVKFQGITFIIVAIAIYLIFENFMGGFLLVAASLILSAIITFSLVRTSWEKDKLKNLSAKDQDNLRDRVSAAQEELAKSNESFKKKLEENNNYKNAATGLDIVHQSHEDAFVITVGILAHFGEDTVAKVFREAGGSPFDKQLIRKLDSILHRSYRDIYGGMTTSIPFPRMYDKIVQDVYIKHINNDGVMTRLGQLREQ